MHQRFSFALLAFCLTLCVSANPQAENHEGTIRLSLEDCIIQALKQNLDVAIDVLNPQRSILSVAQAKEKYFPLLTFSIDRRNTNAASYSSLDAADQVETQYQSYATQVRQLIPSGGSFTVSLENNRNDTNRLFQTINPRYGSTLSFDFVQPLLRNFGFKTNNREIIIARNNQEISEQRFKSTVLETIYSVEEAYWNLVHRIGELHAREQSLALARDLLERNKRSVTIGRLAPIDIQSAVAEVATREADILETEAWVENSEDLLKSILNMSPDTRGDGFRLKPTDKPFIEERALSFDEALSLAHRHRSDLQEIKIDIDTRTLDLEYAKNQLLPDLDLQASYWSPGISGTQTTEPEDNGRAVSGGSSEALSDAFGQKYPNWAVGLSLNIPMSAVFSRTQVAKAQIDLNQTMLRLINKKQQIVLEIKTANRAVETNLKRVKAYRIARELTEQKLETEEEKLRLGQRTNYDVFLFQRDLSASRSNELRSIIDYNLSLAYRSRVLGVSLKERNITLSSMLN